MSFRLRRRTWFAMALVSAIVVGLVLHGKRSVRRADAATGGASTGRRDGHLVFSRFETAATAFKTARVARTALIADIQVVGSVSAAENYFAVVGPSVSGRVVRLHAGVGDEVRKGQVLGEVESVEAGQARAEYIAAKAALSAAEANAVRERDLAERQISSNREREVAAANAVSQRAKMRAALAHLRALGFDAEEVRRLEQERSEGTLIPLRASISGTVIERAVTLGQSVERSTDAFTIADISLLWVLLDIYEKDLGRVHPGQEVTLWTDAAAGEIFSGRVAYVDPVVDEHTHTAHVRIEFKNRQRKVCINQLVTARIAGDTAQPGDPVLAVPRGALQLVAGKTVVFVREKTGFEKRVVRPGMSGGELIEIRSGLQEGELVAMEGASLLKSELLR